MKSRAAGKQAVAVADLQDILLRAARCSDCARTASLPHINIVLGIKGDHTSAGRSACGMDSDAIRERNCQQAVGVLVTQVVLTQEGQLVQILYAVDLFRLHTGFIKFLFIIRDRFIDPLHSLCQALVLLPGNLIPGSAFYIRIKIVFHGFFLSSCAHVPAMQIS